MKTRTKVIIGVIIALVGITIMVNGLFNKRAYPEVIEVSNTTETTTTGTITTTKKKTTKKVVKTTKKIKKVNTASLNEYQQYAKNYGNYDDTQMQCLINLWNRESGWNPNSVNKKSGACGIPQANPCSKIKKQQGSNDWKSQIRWGINYINGRKDYGSPCKAWDHFKKEGWY